MLSGKNILLGVTGGIAAYKTAFLIRELKKSGANIKVIMTPDSKAFVTPLTLATLSENPIISEFYNSTTGEWSNHVEMALWADIFLITPATANTIAKMAHGICDNFLLATYLSAKCQVFIAPAMDLEMYAHPTTINNLKQLINNNNIIIDAQYGELASGLVGKGRMEEPNEIVKVLTDFFNKGPLTGKQVLITAGPTLEQIDPVRFIGNNSSGKMGYELAEIAAKLGAKVTLVSGPTNLILSNSAIKRIDVKSAEEMYNAVHQNLNNKDIIVMAAAVADYTPVKVVDTKIKKKENKIQIELKSTKDILASVGKIKNKNQILVGFALETNDEIDNAKKKLKAKNLDFIVLNSLNDKGAGFELETNKVTFIDKNNKIEKFKLKSKKNVASDIFNKVISLLK
jgi:phosphopantothenoylcysteine decarboxylase/phosphopantothenate--cysteine ligase